MNFENEWYGAKRCLKERVAEADIRHHGGSGKTPPKWIWQELLRKRWLVVRQSRHREPHEFLCKQICPALPKRPLRSPRQCQGNDDAILVRARRSCRLSSREKCLRQGRRSSEEGSKPRSPLRPSRRAQRRRKCRADARAHATGSGLSTRCSRPVCRAPRTNAVPRSPHAALPAR